MTQSRPGSLDRLVDTCTDGQERRSDSTDSLTIPQWLEKLTDQVDLMKFLRSGRRSSCQHRQAADVVLSVGAASPGLRHEKKHEAATRTKHGMNPVTNSRTANLVSLCKTSFFVSR